MDDSLCALFCSGAYLLMAGVPGLIVSSFERDRADSFEAGLRGIFWPVVLPIMLGNLVGMFIRKFGERRTEERKLLNLERRRVLLEAGIDPRGLP